MSSQDPRIERTRRATIAAARTLLLEGDPDRLTVTEIAARAGYSRRAIHSNFSDVAGVVRAVVFDALSLDYVASPDESQPLPREDTIRRIEAVLRGIDAEKEILRCVVDLGSYSAVTDALRSLSREILERGRVAMGLEGLNEIRSAFLVGGFVNVLRDWVIGRLDYTPEVLALEAMEVLEDVRDS